MVISYLLFLVEGLAIVEPMRRSYVRDKDEERALKER
jgi:hypothetical protein